MYLHCISFQLYGTMKNLLNYLPGTTKRMVNRHSDAQFYLNSPTQNNEIKHVRITKTNLYMDFASPAKRCNTKLEKSISTLCTTEHSSSSRPWWWMRWWWWWCRWFWWCWLVLHNPWRSDVASASDVAPFSIAHLSGCFFHYCNAVTIIYWCCFATFLADYV